MLDQAALPWFAELNRSLTDRLDDEAFVRRMRQSVDRLTTLAGELLGRARRDHPGLDGAALASLLAQAPAAAEGTPSGPLLFAP
jgi:signal transduction histidine kinase